MRRAAHTGRGRRTPLDGLHVTSPAPRDVWQRLVDADRDAFASQTPQWFDALRAYGGWEDASRLYRFEDGQTAVLPMVRHTRRVAPLAIEASPPAQWGTGGAVVSTPLTRTQLAAIAADLLRSPALRVSVRPSPLLADVWTVAASCGMTAVPRRVHVLALDGGFDQVWSRASPKVRQNLRRAERTGLAVERATGSRLMPEFYALYEGWVERRAGDTHVPLRVARWLAEPRRKFELVGSHLDDRCRVWIARLDERPVAAVIALVHGSQAVYWRGYSDLALTRPTRANDLLQRLAIEDACDAGCRFYHMGESGGVASLAAFKERFGARPYDYAEYHAERLPLTASQAWLNDLRSGIARARSPRRA
jgi:Acetyltransferase (GNAT) domain